MEHPNQKPGYFLGMYTFFAPPGLGILVVACWTLIMTMLPKAGRVLHQRLLETSMGALSRVCSFAASVESENQPGDDTVAPAHWHKFRGIEFRAVTASHNKAKRATLDNLDFAIAPGIKLALVGRSGNGKSSLISALQRLMDLSSGQIIIDGIDIATLPDRLAEAVLLRYRRILTSSPARSARTSTLCTLAQTPISSLPFAKSNSTTSSMVRTQVSMRSWRLICSHMDSVNFSA
jgi:hypothetical protein